MVTKHILISGRVQGVYYRATAKKIADGLGLTGWVKNTAQGLVEIEVKGSEAALNNFIEWCWQGPDAAQVTAVDVTDLPQHSHNSFHILRD